MNEGVCIFVGTHPLSLWKPEEGVGSPRAGVTEVIGTQVPVLLI